MNKLTEVVQPPDTVGGNCVLPAVKNVQYILDEYRLRVTPGTYHLSVEALHPERGHSGVERLTLTVPNYWDSTLHISDLLLAYLIEPENPLSLLPFKQGTVMLLPSPEFIFRRGQTFGVYFEIYNLRKNKQQQTRYIVETTISEKGAEERNFLTSIGIAFGFTDQKFSVTTSYEYTGSSDSEKRYLILDYGKYKPGDYHLRFRVKDENSGQESAKEVAVTLVE
jgi:hypothetical protein